MATGGDACAVSHEDARVCSRRLAREAWQLVLQCKLGGEATVQMKERTLRCHDRLCVAPDCGVESLREIFGSLHFDHLEFQAERSCPRLEVAHDEIVLVSGSPEDRDP